MAKPELTYKLAMAAAQDAGNRHMRAAGRTVWAVADWKHACEELERLWPQKGDRDDDKGRTDATGTTAST